MWSSIRTRPGRCPGKPLGNEPETEIYGELRIYIVCLFGIVLVSFGSARSPCSPPNQLSGSGLLAAFRLRHSRVTQNFKARLNSKARSTVESHLVKSSELCAMQKCPAGPE